MKKDNIKIIKRNKVPLGEEVYKVIARALINSLGIDICKALVNNQKDVKHKDI